MTDAKPPPVFPVPASTPDDIIDMVKRLKKPLFIPPSPDAGRSWFIRAGLAVDRLLNVLLFNGDDTWTVSLAAAVAEQRGQRWGCVLCVILSVLVQHDHCAITLNPTTQETPGAAIRAGALMALIVGILALGVYFTFETIV